MKTSCSNEIKGLVLCNNTYCVFTDDKDSATITHTTTETNVIATKQTDTQQETPITDDSNSINGI